MMDSSLKALLDGVIIGAIVIVFFELKGPKMIKVLAGH
jgi:hypothetical protein